MVVYNARVFGELVITHVDNASWHWDDRGAGGRRASFWQPNLPPDYRRLGTMVIPDRGTHNLPYDGPERTKEHTVALCVRENHPVPPAGRKPALADPVDYEWVWDDSDTGSKYGGALWRPTPPEGYVAMGLVASDNSHDKPPLDAVVCVREDLTFPAVASDEPVYDDKGAGGKHTLSVWRNNVPPTYYDNSDSTRVLIAPNTYTGHASHDKPTFLPEMRVLCLPIPSEKSAKPPKPSLEDRTRPHGRTPETLTNLVWLPFTAVEDKHRSTEWKLANSPFYRVERKVSWSLLSFIDNDTSTTQSVTDTVTTGVEKESTNTFSVNTGLEISATSGVSVGIINVSVTSTVSLELGFSHARSVKELESHSVSRTLQAPADHAAAVWVGTHTLQVTRDDRSLVAEPVTFHGNSFHYDQFPDAPTAEPASANTAAAPAKAAEVGSPTKPIAAAGSGKAAANTKRSSRT
ncbi:Vps62-related protein [Nocardiopsis sp. CT-R113]|uniref:Vps62-related protein n=1 Tax=Nocardiopsis codii TaxID=3065942 RepID=A0ABU7KFX1_9ACTN|nr:Vps62-related protein [Nocardiopsis sp. CT-R113]MEE2041151.1 Vps62-related protein [Nocardiopsis sp. CT-R113]